MSRFGVRCKIRKSVAGTWLVQGVTDQHPGHAYFIGMAATQPEAMKIADRHVRGGGLAWKQAPR